MRILLTNDDGIDGVGLHVLAKAMRPHGEVVVIAPDGEYSGASSAFGALHKIQPEVKRCHLDGIDEAWSVSGPPALCVMFARLGAFGAPFDLIVPCGIRGRGVTSLERALGRKVALDAVMDRLTAHVQSLFGLETMGTSIPWPPAEPSL